jgi:hypothetical protein
LIDETYSRRLRDFLGHEGPSQLTSSQAAVLSVGRHFRLPSGVKAIVGRHEAENEFLDRCQAAGIRLSTVDHPGPTTLLSPEATEADILEAARITARYSDGRSEREVRVKVRDDSGGREQADVVTVSPRCGEAMREYMV